MINLNVLDRLGLRRLLTGSDDDFDAVPQRGWVEDPWAQLWFAVHKHEWSTLAVVPADPAASSLPSARALAEAGRRYRGEGLVELIDATESEPDEMRGIAATAAAAAATGAQVIVAVRSPLAKAATIGLVRHLDAALLAVPLGEASLSRTRRAIESIGRERFIGSITIRRRTG
jgi:hypothetical protein